MGGGRACCWLEGGFGAGMETVLQEFYKAHTGETGCVNMRRLCSSDAGIFFWRGQGLREA